jgi:hypothetical protein
MAFVNYLYRIYGKDKKEAGIVSAQSEGQARIRAVERGLVGGKKQITKVEKLPNECPYEQSAEDIGGF